MHINIKKSRNNSVIVYTALRITAIAYLVLSLLVLHRTSPFVIWKESVRHHRQNYLIYFKTTILACINSHLHQRLDIWAASHDPWYSDKLTDVRSLDFSNSKWSILWRCLYVNLTVYQIKWTSGNSKIHPKEQI